MEIKKTRATTFYKGSKYSLFFFGLLFFLLTLSSETFAQSQNVTISVDRQNLKAVLDEVEKTTLYRFTYNDNVLPSDKNVTMSVSDMPIETFLTRILSSKKLVFRRNGNTFSILPESAVKDVTVTGKVTDEEGLPLPGATVMVKNTTKGVSADANGEYSLVVPPNSTLVFSFMGYAGVEEVVGIRTNINVTLREESHKLDDVVVIGYGTMKRSDLTGSVGSLNSGEITQSKSLSFVNAMQGRLAGVQISSSSGELGASSRITIRGANSVFGSALPLYVIDGIQMDVNTGEIASASMGERAQLDPLASINPVDIESIEVLKDASATAIYGSRGANGVIIVTTKSGRAGRSRVTYDGNLTIGTLSKRLDVLGASEFIDFRQVVDPESMLFYYDTNGDGNYNEQDQARDPYSLPTHDWQSEMVRTAYSQNHNISIDGGTDNIQFSTSLGYTGNEGIIIENSLERITARAKLDYSPFKRLKLGTNINTSYTTFNGASHSGGDGGTFNGVVQMLVTSRPIEIHAPLFEHTEEYVSPISMVKEAFKLTSLMRTNVNASAQFEIIDGLSLIVNLGGFLSSSKGNEFYGRNTQWGAFTKGSAAVAEQRAYYFSNTDQLQYRKQFGIHKIDAMVAFENNTYNFESFNIANQNYLDESSGVWNINQGSIITGYGSYRGKNNRLSYLGRIYYDLANKYLFTVSLRCDGSDKFGPGNRYGYFPSAAVAWRLSEENFLKDVKAIDNLKLRLSYGVTGNERIPSYQYMSNMEIDYYNGVLGLAPATIPNTNLKWETTKQYNVGIDLAVLKSRIIFTADAYLKITDDLLMPAIIPSQSGFSTQYQNIGRIDNKGLEFQVSTVNIQRKDFEWSTDFNISTNKNIIKNLGGVDFRPTTVAGGWITNVGRIYVGNSIGTGYGYVFDGVYQIDEFTWQDNSDPSIPFEERQWALKPGVVGFADAKVIPGTFKFKNFNGDNEVNSEDMRIISRSDPKFYGGIGNNFRYKGIELSIFLSGMYGNQIFNESRYRLEGAFPQAWMNLTKDFWDNRWTPDNPTNEYGNFSSQLYNPAAKSASSYYVEDASFLRLKTVSLSYTFPQSLLKKISGSVLSNVRIYVTGDNLYTWTKYSGFDPEIDSGNPMMTGFDRISYPRTRSFIFGLSVTF